MQASRPSKEKSQIDVEAIDVVACIDAGSSPEDRRQAFKPIYMLKIKQHNDLASRVRKTLQHRDSPTEELLRELKSLMEYFKEVQTITPIVQVFYEEYKQRLLLKKANPEMMFSLWRVIPLTHIEDYFHTFHLDEHLKTLNEEDLYDLMKDLLMRGKIKEAAFYCYVFDLGKEEFLMKEVLPKLLQGQDLYSTYVNCLLSSHPHLLDAIVDKIDPVAGIRIVQAAHCDVRNYPKLLRHLQLSTYGHNLREFKDWYKCQEMMSHSPLFLEWYANEPHKEDLKESLLIRSGLREGEESVRNPLYHEDAFTYSEEIVGKGKEKKFWKLEDLGMKEEDVHFLDDEHSEEFSWSEKWLLSAEIIGFDSEFIAVTHKYQQDGVSIIQLSAKNKVFVIDFIKLSSSQRTLNLLKTLFEARHIVKLGHSLKCDFLYLSKTMVISHDEFNSFVDLMELFKHKYPHQTQSSLSHIVFALTNVQLSKYQQRSNWNKRPLRRAQLHYAALDARICEVVFEKLSEGGKLNDLQLERTEKPISRMMVNEGPLSYGPECGYFLEKPKFLVDNMLKRLSTYLRNLGLDSEYLSVRDFGVAVSIASNEQRIILTKDKSLKCKKNVRVPVYLIQSHESENMTREVVLAFKINLEEYKLLSRCVKCNNSELVLVDREEALEKLNFKHKDSTIKEFWSCKKCEQLYWEGHSYENSRKRFSTFLEPTEPEN